MPDDSAGNVSTRRDRWSASWPEMAQTDLDQYLNRIGNQHPTTDLAALVTAHLHAFPFVSVPHHSIESMLATIRTACHEFGVGDCFYNSIVFKAALARLGYTVDAALARPTPPGYEDCTLPRTHAILIAHVESTDFLIDVGFGVDGPRTMVPLNGSTIENPASDQAWWTERTGTGGFTLYYRNGAGSRALYEFSTDPVQPADYYAMSFYASNAPDSPLSAAVVLHTLTPNGGVRISSTTIDRKHADQMTRQTISDVDLEDVLRNEIGIRNVPLRAQIAAQLHPLRPQIGDVVTQVVTYTSTPG